MALKPTLQNQVKFGDTEPTLTMQILTAENIPAEIFVYQQLLSKDEAGCYLSEFCNVASLADLDNFSADAPVAGQSMFRLDNISLTFDTFKEAQDAYLKIKGDIQCLLCAREGQLLFDQNCFIDIMDSESCIG